MSQGQELASATVRFKGDLSPINRATRELRSRLSNLGRHNWGSGISSSAMSAMRSVTSLSRNVFFLKEAFGLAARAARGIADAFLEPAMQFEQANIALTSLLGSEKEAAKWMGQLAEMSNRFGLNLQEVQGMAPRLAVLSQGDLNVAEGYMMALTRITALAPKLPEQRKMGVIEALGEGDFTRAGMLLDLPASMLENMAQTMGYTIDELKDANSEISGEVGKAATYIDTGAAGTGEALAQKMGIDDVNKFLSALGASDDMMEAVGTSMTSQLQKLKNHWLDFRTTVGTRVLGALAGPLEDLLTWLEDNEEMVLKLADAFGNFLGEGIKSVLEFLSEIDWEEFNTALMEIIESLKELLGLNVKEKSAEGVTLKEAPVVAAKALATGQSGDVVKAAWGKAGGALDMVKGGLASGEFSIGDIAAATGKEMRSWFENPGWMPGVDVKVTVVADDERFDAYVDQRSNDNISQFGNQLAADLAGGGP